VTEKLYTEGELYGRLVTLAFLIVECVDDHVSETFGDQYVPPNALPEAKEYLVADLRRMLKRQDVPAAERRRLVAMYERYLAGPFPGDTVPLMMNPKPSWPTVRQLLHAKGDELARELSRPGGLLGDEEPEDENAE
jgi:hypothetical protein